MRFGAAVSGDQRLRATKGFGPRCVRSITRTTCRRKIPVVADMLHKQAAIFAGLGRQEVTDGAGNCADMRGLVGCPKDGCCTDGC